MQKTSHRRLPKAWTGTPILRTRCCLVWCVTLLCASHLRGWADEPVAIEKSPRPSFVVYAAERDEEFRSGLIRILLNASRGARVLKADTIEAALAADTEVLVLALPKWELPKLQVESLDALTRRKVICFGRGGVKLFGELGLELNCRQSMHGRTRSARLCMQENQTLSPPKSKEPFRIVLSEEERLRSGRLAQLNDDEPDFVYMGIHPEGESAGEVDIIASLDGEPESSPIVRQGNCVLIGVSVNPSDWTTSFKYLVSETCKALHDRKLEPFQTVRRNVVQPGKWTFTLAKQKSTSVPNRREFHFHFARPTRLTAVLEHHGSDHMRLIFLGHEERRLLFTPRLSNDGQSLELTVDIQASDIEDLGKGDWFLFVENRSEASADCELTIAFEDLP